MIPDNRINLQPPLIDFVDDVGTTGQAHDTFPQPGQARYDWMRSYLIGLLAHQASFQEPIEFRLGSVWFDLNTSSFKYRAGSAEPIFTTEGSNFIPISHGIELEQGLSLQEWFEQVQELIGTVDPNLSSQFSKLTKATASVAMSAGSLVYVTSNKQVGLADQTDPDKSEVVGVTTVSASSGAQTVIQHIGLVAARMDPGLTLLAGQRVWLSTNGRGTNVEPLTGVFRECGVVFDTTLYNPSDSNPTALIIYIPAGTDSSSSATLSTPAEVFVAGPLGVNQGAVVYKTNVLNEVKQADATALTKCNTVVGVARNTAAAGGTVLVDRLGAVTVKAASGISISTGDVIWLSLNTGAVTNVAPSASTQVALVLGFAKQDTATPGGGFVMSWAPRTPTVNP